MRFSTATALCAAPLALAASLQAELVARGALKSELYVRENTNSKSNENSKSSNNNNNNNNGGAKIIQSNTEEVIIIWVNEGGGAATSTVTNTVTVTAAAGQAAPAQATHNVVVGGPGTFTYQPSSIEANVGDMVIFTFMANNHTATQSAFAAPCVAIPNGMDSGFMANINGTVNPAPQMAMQVTVATPIWFYCKQTGHCGKGMTFSINPTANKTQAMFEAMAIAQNGTGTASPITGGSASSAAAGSAATTVATAGGSAETAAAAAPAASSSSSSSDTSSSGGTGIVAGTGTINGAGDCDCSCLCGVGAFPNPAAQGVAAFGGMGGAIPMASLTP